MGGNMIKPIADAEELLHLAMKASDNKNPEQSLNYLKTALELSPDYAEAHLMLGATYADLGMFERAEKEIKSAIKANDQLHVAHFQLGLLYITHNRTDEAITSWTALDELPEDNPYYLFKTGLIALANDDFENCIQYLEAGLESNQENPPLSANIEKILASVRQSQPVEPNNVSSEKQQKSKIIKLTAYENSDD